MKPARERTIVVGIALAIAAVATIAPAARSDSEADKIKEAAEQSSRAAKAFDAIMKVPDKAIPRNLLSRAKAVAVFPRVIKVAVTIGGEGSSTDYFLLLMNDESVEGLMKDKFELGGEAAVAAGPVGRNAGAGTDALMHAAILSYSRSRGLFAGVNVKGVVLRPEDDLNRAVYNQDARDLLSDQAVASSPAEELNSFPETLGRYTIKSSDAR